MAPAHVGWALQVVVDTGVVGPDGLARAGVKRGGLAECRAHIHQTVGHERRRHEGAGTNLLVFRHDGLRERCPPPRDLQVAEVLGRDLVERRVFGVGRVPTERMPLAVRYPRLGRGPAGRAADEEDGERDQARAGTQMPKS